MLDNQFDNQNNIDNNEQQEQVHDDVSSNDVDLKQDNTIDSSEEKDSIANHRKSFFSRLLNIKKNTVEPTITKGKNVTNIHSNYHRDRNNEPSPENFPRKRKILTWQEEAILAVNDETLDLDLAEEIASLAAEVNAKNGD